MRVGSEERSLGLKSRASGLNLMNTGSSLLYMMAKFSYHPFSFLLFAQNKRNKRKGRHENQ